MVDIPRLFWTFMARPQRFCIFCGGAGLTREHVWAGSVQLTNALAECRHGFSFGSETNVVMSARNQAIPELPPLS